MDHNYSTDEEAFELTQKLIDAIEQILAPLIENSGQFPEDFSIEKFIEDVRALVPEAPPEIIVAYLQLYLSPIGEGEEGDFFMGEDFGEEDYSNFAFDTAFIDQMQEGYVNSLAQQGEGDEGDDKQEAGEQ